MRPNSISQYIKGHHIKLLSVTEVAAITKRSRQAVLMWIKLGKLPAHRAFSTAPYEIHFEDIPAFYREGGEKA